MAVWITSGLEVLEINDNVSSFAPSFVTRAADGIARTWPRLDASLCLWVEKTIQAATAAAEKTEQGLLTPDNSCLGYEEWRKLWNGYEAIHDWVRLSSIRKAFKPPRPPAAASA